MFGSGLGAGAFEGSRAVSDASGAALKRLRFPFCQQQYSQYFHD
jgi:hypothetical protein